MGRTPCCEKNGLKKGPWTPEEDQKLMNYIQNNGCGNWRTLPKNAGLQRCGKSCRLRWTNYLRPDIKRGRFSFEEEETIIQLHSILGNKWSAIATRLPGRTDNEIKNYWNTHIRKRLLRMGIDPVTHSPRLDLLDISSILSSSLYNSCQMNLSRLLGVQSLVNPEILRIATLISNSQTEKSNLFMQNMQGTQFSNPQNQNNMPPLVQAPSQEITTCATIPISSSEAQVVEPSKFSDFKSQSCEQNCEQFSSNDTNFSPQSCQINDWAPSNLLEDYATLQNCGYRGCHDQSIMNPQLYENLVFQTNNVNDFSFSSGLSNLSTPTTSPTPLDSNSTYINSSSTMTDDDTESYCKGNLSMFEISHMLDVSDFM